MLDPHRKLSSSRSHLQIVAMGIKQRCRNPKHTSYKNYGARGIKMCDEWADDYPKFIQYCIDNGWQEGLQVDRIDNNGNYEPGNIRFNSRAKGQQNKQYNTLNEDQVREIYILKAQGMRQQAIADKFGVTQAKISCVCSGKLWKEVDIDPSLLEGYEPVNNKSHKFDYAIVREIHTRHRNDGLSRKKLAKIYNCSTCAISHILSGHTWKNVWIEFNNLEVVKDSVAA